MAGDDLRDQSRGERRQHIVAPDHAPFIAARRTAKAVLAVIDPLIAPPFAFTDPISTMPSAIPVPFVAVIVAAIALVIAAILVAAVVARVGHGRRAQHRCTCDCEGEESGEAASHKVSNSGYLQRRRYNCPVVAVRRINDRS